MAEATEFSVWEHPLSNLPQQTLYFNLSLELIKTQDYGMEEEFYLADLHGGDMRAVVAVNSLSEICDIYLYDPEDPSEIFECFNKWLKYRGSNWRIVTRYESDPYRISLVKYPEGTNKGSDLLP